jgi:hypothetical protein
VMMSPHANPLWSFLSAALHRAVLIKDLLRLPSLPLDSPDAYTTMFQNGGKIV